jgi:hypothetical protein
MRASSAAWSVAFSSRSASATFSVDEGNVGWVHWSHLASNPEKLRSVHEPRKARYCTRSVSAGSTRAARRAGT